MKLFCQLVWIAFLSSMLCPVQATAQGELPSPLQVRKNRQQTTENSLSQDRQRVATSNVMIRELRNLIPGGLEEGSELEASMRALVDAFLDGKSEDVEKMFDDIASKQKILPPKELLQAGLWYAGKNPQRGLVMMEKSALEHPDYPGIFVAFARLAINQGRNADALAQLEKAKRLMEAKSFSEIETKHFQTVYLDTMVDLLMGQAQYEAAATFVDQLQAVTPDTPKVLSTFAELAFHKKDVDGSMAYLKKLKESAPNARVPELVLAGWYLRENDETRADEYIRKAAAMYPDDVTTQLEFSTYSIDREDFASAQLAIEKVEKDNGESRVTLSLKARIAFAKQAYGLAETHYERMVGMAPRDIDIRNMYALSLAESEDAQKRQLALQIIAQNLKSVPNNPIVVAAAGWIAFKNGNTGQAEQLLTRVAQTTTLPPEVAYYLATLRHSQGNSQQAKLILEPALKKKGFFYYRAAANDLLDAIDAKSND